MKLAYPVATPEVAGRLLAWSGSIEDIAASLADLGYSGVELFVRDPAGFATAPLAAALDAHRLAVAAIGTGPVAAHDRLTFTDPAPAARAAALARACAIVDLAADLGSQVNVGKLRGRVGHHPDAPRWRDDGFKVMCEHAQRRGVRVTLEPQHRGIIDNLNSTAESLAWLEALALPGLGLMLDSYHMRHEDPSPTEALASAREHLLHIHISDTDRRPPGRGAIDFPRFLQALRGLGYDGFLTVEIEQTPDSAQAAADAAAFLRPLLSHRVS